jgi:hypothetical protein
LSLITPKQITPKQITPKQITPTQIPHILTVGCCKQVHSGGFSFSAAERVAYSKGVVPMTKALYTQFLQYLQDELAVSRASIEQALQQLGKDSHLLPIALWQCGLLSLEQLDQTYDWLAKTYSP